MKRVLALSHVRKSYDGKVVLDDVTLAFLPGAKIGVVGPNGMSQSTLLKMITGQERPDAGIIRTGDTVRISYTDQLRAGIDPGKTVWEVISGGERGRMNLALTLKQGGNLLLLDEPANDLDVEPLASLEEALLEFPGCAVITSHDRWFLDRVATHILAWEGGAEWFWFEGNFAAYEQNKAARLGEETARPHRITYRKLAR
jgi:ATPase subunit of ABC transporter with duplicated ATPase domains